MRALNLSTENQKLLVKLLEKLFSNDKEIKRIEVDTTSSGVVVTFSSVGRNNPLNFIAGKVVNSEIPLMELFNRFIPEQLSLYGIGNRSWAPVFVMKSTLAGRSIGDNLVKWLEKEMKKLEQPVDRNDFSVIEAQMEKIGNPSKEEDIINIIKTSSKVLGNDAGLTQFFMVKQ